MLFKNLHFSYLISNLLAVYFTKRQSFQAYLKLGLLAKCVCATQVVILGVGIITCNLLAIHYRKSYVALMVVKDSILSYVLVRHIIRHIKQQYIAFWDSH